MTDAASTDWTDWICGRCGGVNLAELVCACRQPHDPVAARRRHRDAVNRARRSDTDRGNARGRRRAA